MTWLTIISIAIYFDLLFLSEKYAYCQNLRIAQVKDFSNICIYYDSFLFSFITERCSRWIVGIWIEGRSLAEISECTEEPIPERVRNGLAKVENEDLKFAAIFVICTIVYMSSAMDQTWERRNSDMNWDVDSDENVRLTSNDVALNRLR